MSMKTIELTEGVQLHLHPEKKFKDVTITCEMMLPMNPKDPPAGGLLAMLLSETCGRYPEKKDVMKELDELYGAYYSCRFRIVGNAEVLEFRMSAADSSYLQENIFERQIQLLSEFICHPLIENHHFEEKHFRECHEKALMSLRLNQDDPSAYAASMAAGLYGGVYGSHKIPDMDQVHQVSNSTCTSLYEKFMQESTIDLFVLGSEDERHEEAVIRKYFHFAPRIAQRTMLYTEERPATSMITQQRDIEQSTLVELYSTERRYGDSLLPAFMIGNGILGALPVSFLFQEVREKKGLCYSISSNNHVYDGVLSIDTSMEKESIPEALELIDKQVDKVKKGEFSEELLDTARRMYIDSWKSSMDHVSSLIWDDYRTVITQDTDMVPRTIRTFAEVTRDDIVKAFSLLKKKTVFVLEQENDNA